MFTTQNDICSLSHAKGERKWKGFAFRVTIKIVQYEQKGTF